MRVWLRAHDKRGLGVPWLYVRRSLARAWGITPLEVDAMPEHEVAIELALSKIEAEELSRG